MCCQGDLTGCNIIGILLFGRICKDRIVKKQYVVECLYPIAFRYTCRKQNHGRFALNY